MEPADIHPKMYMYRRIVEAKRYIDENFAEKIDLNGISSQACFSKYHFLRLFKEAFGHSPHKYLTQVRIRQAEKLLRAETPIGDTCYAVGFESIPSFTRLFKEHTGQSPKEYVKQVVAKIELQKKAPRTFVPTCFASNFGEGE